MNSFPQTIASLRTDLQWAGNIGGSAGNDLAVEAIRCLLLTRLAAMEAALAVLQSLTLNAPANTVALLPALSLAELQALEEATQSVPREKLD